MMVTPESGTSPESLLSTSSFTVPEIDPRFGTLGTALTLGTLDGDKEGLLLPVGSSLGNADG
jgi:hypothetical protein